ncbi:lysosomal acid phosphatase-like, partial [Ctenocephalides felis]|uniref:lysosomal acid phosphatase-like n=1 Tax=Ctenocephalides felis TaxID=7515 RepID=UPI000E6E2302
KQNLKITEWDSSKNYWTLASTTRRSQEGALIIGSGLEGKKEAEWTQDKGEKTVFSLFGEYAKFYSPRSCPNFIEQQKMAVKDLLTKGATNYKNLFAKLKEAYKIDATKGPQNVWLAYETLNLQSKLNQAPEWFESMKNELKSFSEEYLWRALTSNENLRKMSGGRMINDILNDIDSIKEGKGQPGAPGKTGNKLSVLTVPQAILAAFVSAFAPKGTKIENQDLGPSSLYPGQGALHVIELHKDNNQWSVKVLYRNNDKMELRPMKLPSCDDKCPYETFKSTLQSYDMKKQDHDKLCKKQ